MNHTRQSTRHFILFVSTLLACLCSFALCEGASLVTSAVLNPVEDAHVRAGFTLQKKNFGSEPVLELQGSGSEAEAYLRFDLSGVDSILKQAKLRLYAGAANPTVATILIKSLGSKQWSEHTVSWKDKPDTDATLAQVQLIGTSPTWYEVDLTSAVKAELAAGNSALNVALVLADTDGNKISINSREAAENKPELVIARSAIKVRIVFRPGENGAPPGYLVDNGSVYSQHASGFTYGWNQDMTKSVVDRNSSAQAVPKQSRSPDSRYAGLVAMDTPELPKPAFWGISLPDGSYNIHLVAGDPGFYDSVYAININDVLIMEGIPDQSKRWVEATKTVSVTSGKLIITNNPKGINNKVCFIEIQEVRESGK